MALPLEDLRVAPAAMREAVRAFPAGHLDWTPQDWEGCPGERFSALGNICHVRDIETQGYHARFRRLLEEREPMLASLDGYRMAEELNYNHAGLEDALSAFSGARAHTVDLLSGLGEEALGRRGIFEEFGPVSVLGLAHALRAHDLQHLSTLAWLLARLHSQ